MDTEQKRRSEFAGVCHLVQQKQLVFGAGGNLSLRLGKQVLMTPSGRALEFLQAEDLVLVEPDGSYSGHGKPSSEYRMHLGCYAARDDINVIMHLHSLYATAVSCLKTLNREQAIPIFTPGYGKRVGALPAVAYMRPGSQGLAEEVSAVIAERNSVLLQNHGMVVAGETVEQALGLAEEIEAEARMYLLLGERGRELSSQEIEDLVHYATGADKEKRQ